MLRNALFTAVGLALIGLSRIAFNTVALRFFGEDLTGRLNVALSLGVLLSLPASTAVGATAIRFIAQARGRGRPDTAGWLYRRTLAATALLAALSAAAALALRAPLAATQGIDAGLVAQAVVVALAYVAYQFFRSALYAFDRVRLYAVLEVVSGAVFFAVLAALAAGGRGRWLLAAFVAGQVVFSLAALAHTRTELAAPAGPAAVLPLRPLVSFSLIALVGTAASLVVRELAVFVSPSVADLGGAAHLALSMSVLTPLQFLPRMFRTVLFARSAELDGCGRREEVGHGTTVASHWLLLVTLPVCALAALAAAPLLTLLGGTPTPERVLVFRLLAAASLIDVVATPAANALPGIGAVKAPAFSAVAALAVTLALWALLTPGSGLTALAVGMLVNAAVKGGVPILAARRLLGARLTVAPWRALGLATLGALGLGLLALWPQPFAVSALYAVGAAALLHRPLREAARELVARVRRTGHGAAEGGPAGTGH